MPSLHKIKGRDILNDVRSGMSDEELMAKYEMSFQALQSAFGQLSSSGLISRKELHSRSIDNAEKDTTTVTTRLPKDYLLVQVPIYDSRNPEIKGVIRDLTQQEIGIIGIEARLDDVKSLVILTGKSRWVVKVMLKAKCRWVKKDSEGEYVCGFRITDITKDNLEKLRILIQELNWGG